MIPKPIQPQHTTTTSTFSPSLSFSLSYAPPDPVPCTSMSRRRAFDTGLTESQAKSQPTSSNNSNSSRNQPSQHRGQSKSNSSSSSPGTALPPRVKPPPVEHASATVPTKEHEAGDQLEADSGGVVAKGPAKDESPMDADDNICIICAEPITYWSVGVCGHKTCQ